MGGASVGQKLGRPAPDLSGGKLVIRQPSGNIYKAVLCMNLELRAKVCAGRPALPLSVI